MSGQVVTECVCGQLPPLERPCSCERLPIDECSRCGNCFDCCPCELEPERREAARDHLRRCSDPFCAACLGQIAANEEAAPGALAGPQCSGWATLRYPGNWPSDRECGHDSCWQLDFSAVPQIAANEAAR